MADEISNFFRENDSVGASSSLWVRPIRKLLDHGKPTGSITVLAFRLPNDGAYPFGALTHTQKSRIVFWPVLPRNADMVPAAGKHGIIDHVTLELPSERMHVTAYNGDGKASRRKAYDFGHNQAWRLQRIEGSGLALWLTFVVKWSVLLDQETAVQRCTEAHSAASAEHLKRTFAQHAAHLNVIDVPLPKHAIAPQYVYCVVYFVTQPNPNINFTSYGFLHGDVDSVVHGWPVENDFEIQPTRVSYEGTEFIIGAACPAGSIGQDVVFLGFPRRQDSP